jgi:hypothetical protein
LFPNAPSIAGIPVSHFADVTFGGADICRHRKLSLLDEDY